MCICISLVGNHYLPIWASLSDIPFGRPVCLSGLFSLRFCFTWLWIVLGLALYCALLSFGLCFAWLWIVLCSALDCPLLSFGLCFPRLWIVLCLSLDCSLLSFGLCLAWLWIVLCLLAYVYPSRKYQYYSANTILSIHI